MAIELKMPALSPTMETGTLAKWLVGVGDIVRPGDLIAEIETDKATMECEAVDEGRITSLVIAEGTDNVAVGTVIATITADADEAIEVSRPEPIVSAESAYVAAAPPAALPPPAPVKIAVEDGINATPLARRIAAAQGQSLASILGTGARGRVVRADLTKSLIRPSPVVTSGVGVPAATIPLIHPAPTGVPYQAVKMSGMRKTIARRLTESKQTVPHFYLMVRCRLDALLALRGDLNAGLADRRIRLSVNDMLIKAMALAMQAVPDANVQYAGDEMYQFDRVDISMAVAIDGGLITPVLRDVGTLSLSAIAQQSKALAAKAREGALTPADYQGGTASISNLGMFGIDEMVPVINPPQSLILGIGAGIEQPWKVDGGLGLATIMAATASFDHRAIDGAAAARFMAAFRDLVENPMGIVS